MSGQMHSVAQQMLVEWPLKTLIFQGPVQHTRYRSVCLSYFNKFCLFVTCQFQTLSLSTGICRSLYPFPTPVSWAILLVCLKLQAFAEVMLIMEGTIVVCQLLWYVPLPFLWTWVLKEGFLTRNILAATLTSFLSAVLSPGPLLKTC